MDRRTWSPASKVRWRRFWLAYRAAYSLADWMAAAMRESIVRRAVTRSWTLCMFVVCKRRNAASIGSAGLRKKTAKNGEYRVVALTVLLSAN